MRHVIWHTKSRIPDGQQTRVTDEGPVCRAVSVQGLCVLIHMSSPSAIRSIESLLLRKFCNVLSRNESNKVTHPKKTQAHCMVRMIDFGRLQGVT